MGSIWSSNRGPTEEDFTSRSSEEFLSADSGSTEEDFTSRSSEEFLSADSGWTSEGDDNLSASTEVAARSPGDPWRLFNKDGSRMIRDIPRYKWYDHGRGTRNSAWNDHRGRRGSDDTKFGGGRAQEEQTNGNGGYRRGRQVTDVRGGLAEDELSSRDRGRGGSEHTLDQRSRGPVVSPDSIDVIRSALEGTVGKCSSPKQSTSGQTGNARATIPGISSQETSTSGLTGNYEGAASPGISYEQQTSTSGPTRISARATSRGISSQKSYLSKSP